MSSLLDPLEEDPKGDLSKTPKAVRLFLYRRPYSKSIEEQIKPVFDLNSLPYDVNTEREIARPNLEFEEYSWIIKPKTGSFDMGELIKELDVILKKLYQYLPQVELLDDDPLES